MEPPDRRQAPRDGRCGYSRPGQAGEEGDDVGLPDVVRPPGLHLFQVSAQVPLIGLDGIARQAFFHGQVIEKSVQQIVVHRNLDGMGRP